MTDATADAKGSPDRIDFSSFDGATKARMGQGNRCVFVSIEGALGRAAIVMTDDEAAAMGRSLIRRAEYARLADTEEGEPYDYRRDPASAAPRPEGLNVERLARAIAGPRMVELDERDEWWTTPRELAESIAAEYVRLGNEPD